MWDVWRLQWSIHIISVVQYSLVEGERSLATSKKKCDGPVVTWRASQSQESSAGGYRNLVCGGYFVACTIYHPGILKKLRHQVIAKLNDSVLSSKKKA